MAAIFSSALSPFLPTAQSTPQDPNPIKRLTSPQAKSVYSMVLADVTLNTSISTPIPSSTPIETRPIECSRDTIPPGWRTPPRFHQIGDVIDCRQAIYRVTREGDPREPQIWTEQMDWSYPSCGVFLTPGRRYAPLSFPRIDVAEIAQEIVQRCVRLEYGLMGG